MHVTDGIGAALAGAVWDLAWQGVAVVLVAAGVAGVVHGEAGVWDVVLAVAALGVFALLALRTSRGRYEIPLNGVIQKVLVVYTASPPHLVLDAAWLAGAALLFAGGHPFAAVTAVVAEAILIPLRLRRLSRRRQDSVSRHI